MFILDEKDMEHDVRLRVNSCCDITPSLKRPMGIK